MSVAAAEVSAIVRPDYRLEHNLWAERGTVFLTGTQALVRLLLMQRAARRRRAAGTRRASSAATAARRWAWSTRRSGRPARSSPRPASASCRRSTRNSAPRRCWARSASSPTPSAPSTACSRCGTARARASTAPATRSSTATPTAARRTAACWWWPATTTAASRRRCRTRATSSSRPSTCRWWRRPTWPSTSSSASTATRCRATRATGSRMTALSEVVESGATVDLDAIATRTATWRDADGVRAATGHAPPADGLHYRWPDLPSLRIETRLADKLAAVAAFAQVNSIDRDVIVSPQATVGIVTCGKAHYDLMEVLRRLEITPQMLADAGVRLYKVGLSFPLETTRMRRFARGLKELLVIEEKGAVVETQLRELFYNAPADERPVIVGKRDAPGAPLVSARRRAAAVAADRARRALDRAPLPGQPRARRPPAARARLHAARAAGQRRRQRQARAVLLRRLPAQHQHAGARGLARAGRHRLPLHGLVDGPRHAGPDPDGRRGRRLGQPLDVHQGAARVPEPRRRHLLPLGLPGDPPGGGVEGHDHLQDPVQRRGGDDRRPTGGRRRSASTRSRARWRARACEQVVVVSDDIAKYDAMHGRFPPGTTFHPREELDAVQRRLREMAGVTVLIYEQTCAAEKRRRRKKGELADPARRLFINERVCEGCGDCSVQSNCVAVLPLETPLGPQAQDRPEQLQQGLFLRQGLLPELRRRARRPTAQEGRRTRAPAAKRFERRVAALPLPAPHRLDRPVRPAGHRRRRHRRGDGRRGDRDGRAPGGQERQRARLHGLRAEGRLGAVVRALGRPARAPEPGAHRHAAGRRDPRLRPGGRRLARGAADRAPRPHARAGQRARGAGGRVAEEPRCQPAGRRAARQAALRRRRRARRDLRRAVAGRGLSRRHHRRQHPGARLRLAARPGAGEPGRAAARDRAQRRGGAGQPAGVLARPAGGRRPGGLRRAARPRRAGGRRAGERWTR